MKWNRRLTALTLAAAMLASGTAAAAQSTENVVVATIMAVPADMGELPGLDSSYLVLPSQQEPLGEDYVPYGLVDIVSRRNDAEGKNANGGLYMSSSQRMQMVDYALAALERMFVEAENQGVVLYIRQAYRSYADEERSTQRMAQRGEIGEVPGQSDWQTGLSVTVVPKELRTKTLTAQAFDATAEAKWLQENCARFGFVVRYPDGKSSVTGQEYQPWRLRYVGESAAAYMMQRGMTLEELRAELNVTGGAPVWQEPAAVPVTEAEESPVEAPAEAPAEAPVEEIAADDNAAAEESAEITAEEPEQERTAEAAGTSSAGAPWVEPARLTLASAAQPLDAGYVPENLQMVQSRRSKEDSAGVYMASSQNMYLVDVALQALTDMFAAAEREGITLYLRQAYRSYEDEAARYERLASSGKADLDKPGESDWQTGLAVTVVPKSLRTKTLNEAAYLDTMEGRWVAEHCVDYGFIQRYPQGGEQETGRSWEPWHLRFVGVEAARYITANGLTLEGFCALESEEAAAPVPVEETPVPAAEPEEVQASVEDVQTAPAAEPETTPVMEAVVEMEPTAEPAAAPSTTPVPELLPGGIELVEITEDGDWEYSLFGK